MHILLATDGSRFSQAAGNLLMRLPWPATRALTVLSVVDKPEWLSSREKRTEDDRLHEGQQLRQGLRQETQRLLAQEAERFAAMGWAPQTLVREGHAAHEIVSVAEELRTNVIVVGSRGLGRVKRFLLGSVSQHVMTYAPCSVLIARQPDDCESSPEDRATAPAGESDTPLRVLLAYDGSPMAKMAVETLASLALDDRTHILVTTVMALMTYYRMDILQTMSSSWQAEKQAAQDCLEHIAQRLRPMTPNVTVQLRNSDDTSQEILEAAHAFDANLIMVGHKGKSGIERLLLGSVASRVVHHAPCSVWVIRG
jgi:nucleotide-binding universal stress UspA family protein